jgi:mitochondrial fission protein ELM1
VTELPPDPLVVWCVTDHKPGHESQLRGLLQALASRHRLELTWIDARQPLYRRTAPRHGRPDFIIAAGHGTHLRALLMKWWYGGQAIVLMKPSLPRGLFDLCIVPEHDGVATGKNVLATVGTLNDIVPGRERDPGRGLVMLGGPSKHHEWSDEEMVAQLRRLKALLPRVRWTLTTSRRTPATFRDAVEPLLDEHCLLVPHQQTDRNWLREQYGRSGVIWVTEDSASMVYESLATGAAVGVLAVPRLRDSRVSRGLDRLLESGALATLQQVEAQGAMPPGTGRLSEADRVAAYIDTHLYKGGLAALDESPAGFTQFQ